MNKNMVRLKFKRKAQYLCVLILGILTINIAVSLCKYPEKYITTWKYQLQNDIKQGNQVAIDYYNNTYIANGVELY